MDYYRRVMITGEDIEEVAEQEPEPLLTDAIPGYDEDTRLRFGGLDDNSAETLSETE